MEKLMLKILTAILILCLLAGCTLGGGDGITVISGWGPNMFSGLKKTDAEEADRLLEQLLAVLEDSDEAEMKALFSKNTLDNAEDLEEQIEALADFYEGTVVSWKRWGLTSSEELEGDLRTKAVCVSYDVTTTAENYRVAMKYCAVNTGDSGELGLQSVCFIKARDTDPELAYWGGYIWEPGIVFEGGEADE